MIILQRKKAALRLLNGVAIGREKTYMRGCQFHHASGNPAYVNGR